MSITKGVHIATGRDALEKAMQKAMGLGAWTGCLCSLDACRRMWEKAVGRSIGDFVCTAFELSFLDGMYEASFYLYNSIFDAYKDMTVQNADPAVAVCLAYLLCFSPGPDTRDLLEQFAETKD